jgi:hypothetical protein
MWLQQGTNEGANGSAVQWCVLAVAAAASMLAVREWWYWRCHPQAQRHAHGLGGGH